MQVPSDDQRQDYEDFNGPPPMRLPERVAQKPRKRHNVLALIIGMLILLTIGLLLAPSVSSILDDANRLNSSGKLAQIGLAIHNYNDTFDEMPNNSYSSDGKPLLSWRVHILPFVEDDNLYRQYRLNEPWDSPNNLPLLQQMPRIYAHPTHDRRKPPGKLTHYRGCSNPGAVFERRPIVPDWERIFVGPAGFLPEPIRVRPGFTLQSMKDGSSDTILVVESSEPVEWTKPNDLDGSGNVPLKLGGLRRGDRFNALMSDGSVRSLKQGISESTLCALITHSGGEALTADWNQ